ncbi:hypothetical protein AAMO2058_000277900 [Amorphochlora amoebiformis]
MASWGSRCDELLSRLSRLQQRTRTLKRRIADLESKSSAPEKRPIGPRTEEKPTGSQGSRGDRSKEEEGFGKRPVGSDEGSKPPTPTKRSRRSHPEEVPTTSGAIRREIPLISGGKEDVVVDPGDEEKDEIVEKSTTQTSPQPSTEQPK